MAAPSHIQYDPARHITVEAVEVLAPARLVKVSVAKTDGANIKAEYSDGGAAAAGAHFGVTAQDFLAIGDIGVCYRRGSICEIEAGGTVAALAYVKGTTDGKVVTASATGDVIIGQALTGGANAERLMVDTFASPTVLKIA